MFRPENFPTASNEPASAESFGSAKEEQIEKARAIVKAGGFDATLSKLKEEGLLETVIEETKQKYTKNDSPRYERHLAGAGFLNDQDWKLVTLMDLFDPETMEHEMNVFNLSVDHLGQSAFVPVSSQSLEGKTYKGGYSVSLEQLFEHEGVLKEHFLRAALHHDIGKIDIPDIVLTNRTTDEEWIHIMSRQIAAGDTDLSQKLSERLGVDVNELFQASGSVEVFEEKTAGLMKEKKYRGKDIIPVRYALPEEGSAELRERGFSPDSTLADIIRIHEERSGDILRNEGFVIEAELAENHHNYHLNDLRGDKEINKPMSIGTLVLNVCLADVLHIADVEQAMQAKRVYKKAFSPFETWSSICDLAEEGKVTKEVAYIWLKTEIDEMGEAGYEKLKGEHHGEEAHLEHFLQQEEEIVWNKLDSLGYLSSGETEKRNEQ